MAVSVLPDRERRHLLQFHLLPRLPYGIRLGVAGVLILCGLAIQVFWASQIVAPVAGAFLLLAGNVFLVVRGYDLTPPRRRKTRWEKTTRDRFAEARRLESEVRDWDETFADITCWTGVIVLAVLAAIVGACWLALTQGGSRATDWGTIFAIDAAVLLLPHWVTGTRRGWRPTALRKQLDALDVAMRHVEQYADPPCQIQPMFEVTGKDDKCTPQGARVFVRFPDGPEDFLGLQFQVALNNVQGTKYAYLYAVLVAKNSFGLLEHHLAPITEGAPSLVTVESNQEEDVDVIVIRQYARGGQGYHTKPKDIRRIAQAAWEGATRAALSGPASSTSD